MEESIKMGDCLHERKPAAEVKSVLYTQRVEIVESYGERRDCADQNIPRFIKACGYRPIAAPNLPVIAGELVSYIKPAGILLTGGNSLVLYGGDAPERDAAEKELIDIAFGCGIPVYGFCRGMQALLDYFGCELEDVQGHVAVRHRIQGKWGMQDVNSYHSQACFSLKQPLEVLARAEDGVIEAIGCRQGNMRILGTMWHPEREWPFALSDIRRVQDLFG